MKRIQLLIFLFLGCAVSAQGQSTTVSGTVTDAGSQAWFGGTYSFQLVPNPNFPNIAQYTWTGGALQQTIAGTLNGSGAYSQSVPSNTAISPQGSKWKLTVCPLATSSCFDATNTTISGGTQTLNVTPPVIAINLTSPGPFTRAYSDTEIVSAVVAAQYYNLTTQLERICNTVVVQSCTVWANVGSGAGGGVAFSAITSGTNTTAAMHVGTGATLDATGTGTNIATLLTAPGATSGSATVGAAAIAGTPNQINLPTATGTNGQVLKTDGGNPQQTSWTTAASTPGGSTMQLQFNNGGAFGGIPGSVVNGTNGTLSIVAQAGTAATLNLNSVGSLNSYFAVGGSGSTFFTIDGSGRPQAGSAYLIGSGGFGAVTNQLVVAYDTTTKTSHFNVNNGAGDQSYSGSWSCTNVAPVTVNANVATDQNLMACTIPAGTLNRVGRSLRIKAKGIYSTPAASTSQMTVKIELCTVSGCGSGTVITPISIQSTALGTVQITNDNFSLRSEVTTQTAGASSAYEASGEFLIDLSTLATAADSEFGDTNTATVGTIDSTAQLFLQTTFAFSNASASNSATQRQLIIETVN
jgi:hypothetical protein